MDDGPKRLWELERGAPLSRPRETGDGRPGLVRWMEQVYSGEIFGGHG